MARFSKEAHQQRGQQAAAPGFSSTSRITLPSYKNLIIATRILMLAGIGFVGLLNVQPWIELARQIAKELTNIPFLDSLVSIPFLGGWIAWFFLNIVSVLGIVLWLLTQLMEILPSIVKNPTPNIIAYRWLAYLFESFICLLRFPFYEGGANAIFEEFPNWDSSLIDWWMLGLFVVTMFSFEAIFHLVRNVRANLDS